MHELIFGKDLTSNIVSAEIDGCQIELFIEKDGIVSSKFIPHQYWILSPIQFNEHWKKLKGNLHYQYIRLFDTYDEFYKVKRLLKNHDIYFISDKKEAAMVLNGFSYFKNTKVDEVSILCFDIESTGIQHNSKSKVLLISNTFVKNGITTKRLFAYDDYDTEAGMFDDWCDWVHELNPSILAGHNIFGYDLPYLSFCAQRSGTDLYLGRDGSTIQYSRYTSKFRKDGSQDYDYTRAYIYGREIIDTMFLAYHFDFARTYQSYGLKQIIKQEGLEKEGRHFYDAGNIGKNYLNPVEWVKIKAYAEDDADDALALYKLMIPAYFYLTPSIPKSFQTINYSASGSQINSFLVRSYLQEGHSIPKATPTEKFEGAISDGWPGIYKNVFKLDVSSLYPSIMIEHNVYDKKKDPLGNFSKMVKYFTDERINNKKKSKETGDRYYKDLEQAEKIICNSAYGMLAAQLNFNSPVNAAFVTRIGREILTKAMDWAKVNGFTLVNVDTDSLSICYNNEFLSEEDRFNIKETINSLFPNTIRWEDDGYYISFLVLAAKNYVLYDGKKIKLKGSSLKSSKLEPFLKDFQKEIIDCFIFDKQNDIPKIYEKYIKDVFNVKDINKYCSKKTITEKVMNAERTTEKNILAAVEGIDIQMGDKVFIYFTNDKIKKLKRAELWNNDHNPIQLCKRVWETTNVFKNVLDIKIFPRFHLKKAQKELLPKLLTG